MDSTSHKKFSVLSYQDGIPIYQTAGPIIEYSPRRLEIRKEEVPKVPGAFVLHNVLSPEECKQFVELTEQMEYGDAPVTTGRGMVMMKDLRNNERVIWQTDESIWGPIWQRVKDFVPERAQARGGNWEPYALNDRLRFYKYQKGQVFNRHFDGDYAKNAANRSLMTLIIYLNEGAQGGETTFFPSHTAVTPKQGMALFFFHGSHRLSPEHEGSLVHSGHKYVLRSDLMFKQLR